ncbi:LysR family transcriptional regulator [Bordetella ansorpii]|uniref:LysR family transcriptional regulator n=1 Tax=Bordetella ansorpii TaxID=288768 RepID=A0A157P795_9BORD|nr:LysR family transcriptional regulator [Bordetella ansorpii]SAI29270.1 LysR family transcriptional regulator [Bordetella ansorpii]
MNLSVRHMRAFTALASLRSFTRAAEHCCLTQSAFSALIANLESDLGVKLFSRNTRNVELTAEGQAFQEIVAHLLPETERALAEMRDHVERRKGKVALAALPSISAGILPGLIARYSAAYPGIAVHVEDVASTVCLDMVRDRKVDFALCAAASPSVDLDIEVLARDTFYLICADGHPLARRRHLEVRDVIDLPIIGFERNSSIRQHLDAAVYPRQWRRGHQVNSLSTAAGFVAAGLGVTIAPTLALYQFRIAGLRAVPLTLPINERDICLARRRDAADSLAAQAFIGLMREHLPPAVQAMAPPPAGKRAR